MELITQTGLERTSVMVLISSIVYT